MESLSLYFLNVGHGDCTFVDFEDRLTMIDVNNSKSLPIEDEVALAEAKGVSLWAFRSQPLAPVGALRESWEDYYRSFLVDPYDFYVQRWPGRSVFRYIQTHPDMDHMSGLNRFFFQESVPLVNFWDVAHTKELDKATVDASQHDWNDWVAYNTLRSGHANPGTQHKVLELTQGASASYYREDRISILGPTDALVDACNAADQSRNDASYVLKLEYGGRSLILPGDAEAVAWQALLDTVGPAALDCDILKAAHHGRESGYHEDAVEAMSPEIVICSVGKKPDTDASDEYAAAGARVLSTRYHGTLHVRLWEDGEVWIEDRNGTQIDSLPPLT
jgi:beta-lactamase superfamily II metal-dependent hydrolase